MNLNKIFVDTSYIIALIISEPILLEIGNALSRGFEVYKQYKDKQWGLVDCISFVIMWDKHLTDVLTFDKHFTQAGFSVLPFSF